MWKLKLDKWAVYSYWYYRHNNDDLSLKSREWAALREAYDAIKVAMQERCQQPVSAPKAHPHKVTVNKQRKMK